MILVEPDELDIAKDATVAFTGRRADKLPWERDAEVRCLIFLKNLQDAIENEYKNGKRFFISGMANGVDSYAAEAVLSMKRQYPDIELVCVFPYAKNHITENVFYKQCDKAVVLSEDYFEGCMQRRNRYMVSHASTLIACYEGGYLGGTGMTVRMAEKAGLDIVIINP